MTGRIKSPLVHLLDGDRYERTGTFYGRCGIPEGPFFDLRIADDTTPADCPQCLTTINKTKETRMGFWDDIDPPGTDYIRFDDVGDGFEGIIAKLTKQDFDGRTAVEAELDDGRKVTIGQTMLLRTFVEQAPDVGTKARVVLVEIERRGAKTLKRFEGEFTFPNGETYKFNHADRGRR